MEAYELPELFQAIAGFDTTFHRMAWPRDTDDNIKNEQRMQSWYAVLGHIPLVNAVEEVRRHYAHSRDCITPADIRDGWNQELATARGQGEHQRIRARPKPAASPETGLRGYAMATAALLRARGQDPDVAMDRILTRRSLLRVKCRYCKAPHGKPCVVPGTRRDQEFRDGGFHPARWEDAGLDMPTSNAQATPEAGAA